MLGTRTAGYIGEINRMTVWELMSIVAEKLRDSPLESLIVEDKKMQDRNNDAIYIIMENCFFNSFVCILVSAQLFTMSLFGFPIFLSYKLIMTV